MEGSGSHHSRSNNSRYHVVFCRIFICAIFEALVLLSSINASHSHASSNPAVCQSEQCLRSAADLKRNMDRSEYPCDDFYSYVCGRWPGYHHRSRDWITYDWSNELETSMNQIIRAKLEANLSQLDPKPVVQARDMFGACLKSLKMATDRNRFRGIKKYLKDLGLPVVPTLLKGRKASRQNYKFDWVSSVAKIQRKLALDVLIGLTFDVDHRDRERFRITLGYSDWSGEFPMYVWSVMRPKGSPTRTPVAKPRKWTSVDSYPVKLGKSLSRLIALTRSTVNITNVNSRFLTLAEEFQTFNKQLSALDGKSENETPTYYTVAELQNITDSHITPRKPYPVWQHYFDVLFADLPDVKPAVDEKLVMKPKNLKYLCNLVDFLSKQPPELIELYIWKKVTEFLVDHPFNKLKTEEDCIGNVKKLMGLAVIYATADKTFLKETKPRVEQLFNDIRSEFNQMVRETDWVDANTKAALLEKSKAMKALIGLPKWILNVTQLEEHYRDLQINQLRHFDNWVNAQQLISRANLQLLHVNTRNLWTQDPLLVTAYATVNLNVIAVPVGLIQYPYYYLGLEALNYGALGHTIAHELTHGFAELGRHFDKFGSYGQWWSNQALQEYEKRANCLVKQYNGYYVREAFGYVDGSRTLNENIADNGGLRAAFRAYRAYVKRNGPEPQLPGFFENFTHEQLFFVSFANRHCGAISSNFGGAILQHPHSPLIFRVLGALSNMEEFSEAFQCPRGSKMNPEKKCRIW